MKQIIACLVFLASMTFFAPSTSAQRVVRIQNKCYRDDWGYVTCYQVRNGVTYYRDADNWRWHRHRDNRYRWRGDYDIDRDRDHEWRDRH
jgi:hypothetical protein